MVVKVDTREPEKMIELLRREGVPAVRADIQWTDYIIEVPPNVVPVERKTVEDFVASIIDGRIFNQAYHLSTNAERSFIIVEGVPSIALFERGLKRKAYYGALASLALKRSPDGKQGAVSIVVVETMFDTVLLIASIHRVLQKGDLRRFPIVRAEKRDATPQSVLVAMLQAVPGIGREKAKAIAEKFGTVEALINAPVSALASVRGVSYELARKIKYFLTGKQV